MNYRGYTISITEKLGRDIYSSGVTNGKMSLPEAKLAVDDYLKTYNELGERLIVDVETIYVTSDECVSYAKIFLTGDRSWENNKVAKRAIVSPSLVHFSMGRIPVGYGYSKTNHYNTYTLGLF